MAKAKISRKSATKKPTKSKRTSKKSKTVKSKNIRQQVRDLMLEVITERNLTMDQLSAVANTVLTGATDVLKDALPTSRKSILVQVLNGIDDAWAATAKASVSTVRHAQRYGLRFAKHDLSLLGKKLGALEKEFNATLVQHAKRLGGDVGKELDSISKQIQRAGTQIRPAAKAAQKAITEEGLTLAKEVASTGSKAGRKILQGTLMTASGLLEGVGKAVGVGSSSRKGK